MYDHDPTLELADIAGALAGMAAVDYAQQPVGVLTDKVKAWCAAVSALQATGAKLLAAWDAQCAWADDAAVNASAWLRTYGELDDGAPAMRVARRLRDWAPLTAAALDEGSLSYTKAKIMMLALNPEIASHFADSEQVLVATARQVTVGQTKTLMRRWRAITEDIIDTDHDTDPAERLGAERAFKLWESFGGTVAFEGTLAPEVGQAFKADLARREQRLFRADVAEARAAQGGACGCGCVDHGSHDPDNATGLTLARTPTQRRADALAEIIMCGLQDSGTGDDGRDRAGPTTKIVITTTPDELTRAATLHLDRQPTTNPRFADPLARLADNIALARYDDLDRPVDATTLAMLACDCVITRMVLDTAGVPLDLGRDQRLVSPAQRRALIQRDHRCAFPDCDRPARWCDAHHMVPWEIGGLTDLSNLVLLCRHHHRHMHKRQPWTVHIDPTTRRPFFTRPDGTPNRQPGLHPWRPPHPPPDEHTRAA